MPPTSDRRIMHLDPHILDFLKALEAQGGLLSTRSQLLTHAASCSASRGQLMLRRCQPLMKTPPARAALAQVNDTLRAVFAHNAPEERDAP